MQLHVSVTQCEVWQDPGAQAFDVLADGTLQDLSASIVTMYSATVAGTVLVLDTSQVTRYPEYLCSSVVTNQCVIRS